MEISRDFTTLLSLGSMSMGAYIQNTDKWSSNYIVPTDPGILLQSLEGGPMIFTLINTPRDFDECVVQDRF